MTTDRTAYEALLETVRAHGAFHPLTGKEATEEYLKRLAKAVSGVTKRLFDDMPQQAQEWFDAAATAIGEQMPVPVPDGFTRENNTTAQKQQPATAAPPPEPAAAPPQPVVTPGRIRRPTGSAVPLRAAMPPPRPMPPKPAAQITVSDDEPVSVTIARMLIADQTLSLAALLSRVKSAGISASKSTVRLRRYNVLSVIELLREAGWQPPG